MHLTIGLSGVTLPLKICDMMLPRVTIPITALIQRKEQQRIKPVKQSTAKNKNPYFFIHPYPASLTTGTWSKHSLQNKEIEK